MKATNSPLAGTLQLDTDEYTRVKVTVTDGHESWERDFYDYAITHSISLLGFKPNRSYQIGVTVHNGDGRELELTNVAHFDTAPLPRDFPKLTLLTNQPAKMEPGYTLFVPGNLDAKRYYIVFVNLDGEVVWYTPGPANPDIRQLPDGNMLLEATTNIVIMNMLGQPVRVWPLPPGVPSLSHEIFPTDHGTFLTPTYGSRLVQNFPTSATNPNAPHKTAAVWDNPIAEISTDTGKLLQTWFFLDLLSPTRISYHTFINPSPLYGWDWAHVNGIIEDPRDGWLIASVRHQSAVVKFNRNGAIKWILGPHENWPPEFQQYLLTPVGEPFHWQYSQHAPIVTPHGTLLMFDNGNYRAMPFDAFTPAQSNYSRGVEFLINETNMTVSQVWEYGRDRAERLYSDTRGNAEWLPIKGNVNLTFANITYVNGAPPSRNAANSSMARIVEVTHGPIGSASPTVPGSNAVPPEVVFDLAVFDYTNTNKTYLGCVLYRSHRVPDLYPVVTPIQRLTEMIQALTDTSGMDKPGLMPILDIAEESLKDNKPNSAVNQLHAFQNKLSAQAGSKAIPLFFKAQAIIDALSEGESSLVGARHFKACRLEIAEKNGVPHLRFLGEPSKAYAIQVSSDLLRWMALGDAHYLGNSVFEYEDLRAANQARYYRIVESP